MAALKPCGQENSDAGGAMLQRAGDLDGGRDLVGECGASGKAVRQRC
jgi:hypothetical protein